MAQQENPYAKYVTPQAQGGAVFIPTNPNQQRMDTAEQQAAIEARRASAASSYASAAATGQNAAVRAEQAKRDEEEARRLELARGRKATLDAFDTGSILRTIRNARRIAREEGGTGFSSLASWLPETAARNLLTEIDPLKANLAFNKLDEMRKASKTGGALGSVSAPELKLLESSVASLDLGVDLPTFLRRLDEIERRFIQAQVGLAYADENGEPLFPMGSPEYNQLLRDEFGYTGVLEGEEVSGEGGGLSTTQDQGEFPELYQNENLRYLRDNWGQITPEGYTAFRANMDQEFGFEPNLSGYARFAQEANEFAAGGGRPEQLGGLEMPPEELGMFRRGISRATQSPGGTFMLNAGNALTAGLGETLTGTQQQMELNNRANPMSSTLGEIAGSTGGAFLTGGALGAIGGGSRLAANPLTAEALYGATYGATQDPDNPVQGAGAGVAGALAGDFLGRGLSRLFPTEFAPDALRAADESVPTLNQVKDETNALYNEMQRKGVAATQEQFDDLSSDFDRVLAGTGRVGGSGERILDDTPTETALRTFDSYIGTGDVSPKQVQVLRERLAEGLLSRDAQDVRITGKLLDAMDNRLEGVLPGYADARSSARRGIESGRLSTAFDVGDIRGSMQPGLNEASALRSEASTLAKRLARGDERLSAPVASAVRNVAVGDAGTNAFRTLGRYAGGSPLSSVLGGGTGYVLANSMGADPLTSAGIGLGTALFGSAARKISDNKTLRAVKEAELTALGGQEYADLLEAAKELSARRARMAFSGPGASVASLYNREPEPMPLMPTR
ncbi:MAG: hypothetical protein MJH10_11935 [Epibacterium sp.]|nr:hypothetical protein [Epibacterium sp.]NQX74257.1 hypothetical protein [Epibacterium sp.]